MNKNKHPTNTITAIAATLFISGCVTNHEATPKTEATAACCLACKKPDNGCKLVAACRHASPTLYLEPEKCKKLGGLLLEEAQQDVSK